MLLSIVKEYEAAQGRQWGDPYAAWAAGVRQFRSDWVRGGPVGVEQLRGYLEHVPKDQQYEAVQDLIAEHLQLAWRANQGTNLEPYLSEFSPDFSQFATPARVPADLIEDEFLARYVWPTGDTPSIDEYQQRFPARPDVTQRLRCRFLGGGRYTKLHELGRGAMGVVFEAFDRHLSRVVAIKQPRPGIGNFPDLLHRFAEEARVTAGLDHPAIVTVHEHHADNAAPFYVMRLANGQPLSEHIQDYHQPPIGRSRSEQRHIWHQLLQTFLTVCDAIEYAHARGVLHRDLKPDNVIVGRFGATAILDWGMAKRLPRTACPERDTCETADLVVGTPQYMPPEQADGISDARSDVFGLGTILYEMLTAGSPHAWPEGSRPADWLRIVREARIAPPRRLKPRLPRALEAICLKALARNPNARYRSAADLAQDVRRHLVGESVAAQSELTKIMGWQRWLPGR